MNANLDLRSHWAYDIPCLDDTRSNYDDWKFRVSIPLRLRGLMNIVKGVKKCLPEPIRDSKDQDTLIAFEKWESWNHQALAKITLSLKKEPLKYVKQYSLALEI